MPATAKQLRELPDDELLELLKLLSSSDSAELKLTVREDQHRSTVAALGMDPLDAQIRLVTFFDTRDLALQDSGLVVRARRIQGRDDDSVVKLRPVAPDDLPSGVRESPNLVTEVDAMPGGYVCSATLKATGVKRVRRVLTGQRPISKLFSQEQRAFYAAHAPAGLELDDLSVLGPIFVLKLNFRPPELTGRKLVAEMWLYPDGSRILELSTKCVPDAALRTALELRAYLQERGVDLSGETRTKTHTALTYFSKHLPATA